MKKSILALWMACTLAVIVACGNNDDKQHEEGHVSSAKTYYVGFLTRGATWSPEETAEVNKLQEEHLANISRLADSGLLSLAGPFLTDDNSHVIRGLFFFDVGSIDEARRLSDTDPAVKAGRLAVNIVAWKTPSELTYDSPVEMTVYRSVIFERGPGWTADADYSFDQVLEHYKQQLQATSDSGKVVLAGSFVDAPVSNPVVGLIIARADSLELFQDIVPTLPAVESGQLIPTVMDWYGPAGLRLKQVENE